MSISLSAVLIANGTAPHEIRIIFATGIHRKVTEEEKSTILTPFIAQRIKTLDHDPRDLMQLMRLGETSGGIPIELNRALTEHDQVIIIGGVTFHYFAGFTGGRKLICPGLASTRTISETHKLAFDCERKTRRDGVDTGKLDGNAVNEAFMEAVAKIDPAFAISTIVNDDADVVDLYCGDWRTSHRAACDAYAAEHTIQITEKRDLVIASCGGYPFDINLIQAHKALEAASHACNDGGTIILLAECADGLGRDDFLKWFDAANSSVPRRYALQKIPGQRPNRLEPPKKSRTLSYSDRDAAGRRRCSQNAVEQDRYFIRWFGYGIKRIHHPERGKISPGERRVNAERTARKKPTPSMPNRTE